MPRTFPRSTPGKKSGARTSWAHLKEQHLTRKDVRNGVRAFACAATDLIGVDLRRQTNLKLKEVWWRSPRPPLYP